MKLIRTLLSGAALFSTLSLHAAIATWDFDPSVTGVTQGNITTYTYGSEEVNVASLVLASGASVGQTGGYVTIAGLASPVNTTTFTLTFNAGASPWQLGGVGFDYRRDGDRSATSMTWNYSGGTPGVILSGTAFTDLNQWNSGSVNLSGINLNPNQSFTLVGTIQGAQTGNLVQLNGISFDNFSLSAVPEPTHIAMAIFGLVFVGATATRSYFRRS